MKEVYIVIEQCYENHSVEYETTESVYLSEENAKSHIKVNKINGYIVKMKVSDA